MSAPVLTAEFTSWDGEPQTLAMPLSEDVLRYFVPVEDWDGPEVLHALCIGELLGPEDFGGQGDLIGRDLIRWSIR